MKNIMLTAMLSCESMAVHLVNGYALLKRERSFFSLGMAATSPAAIRAFLVRRGPASS